MSGRDAGVGNWARRRRGERERPELSSSGRGASTGQDRPGGRREASEQRTREPTGEKKMPGPAGQGMGL